MYKEKRLRCELKKPGDIFLVCSLCKEEDTCLSIWFECPKESMCSDCLVGYLNARIDQELERKEKEIEGQN